MGWISGEMAERVDGSKWNVYDIPNPWVATRPGVAVLRWWRQDGGNDAQIVVGGLLSARQASRANYGGTINAYVPAGHEVRFVLNESSLTYWKFIEL